MAPPKQVIEVPMALVLGAFVVWLSLKMRSIVENMVVETKNRPPTRRILQDKKAVSKELCNIIVQIAKFEIDTKGWFIFAVAGGSVLEALTGLVEFKDSIDWTKVSLAFVNHKCIPLDSPKASVTIAKKNFCEALNITDIILPFNTLIPNTDGTTEAQEYADLLVKKRFLPVTYDNMPIFDLVLLGLGADGHLGSNHPNSIAVQTLDKAVVASTKEGEPSSITLSIPTINAAKQKVFVVTGGKDGKKEAVQKAMIRPNEGERGSFPAQLIDAPLFLLDVEAAANLSDSKQ